MNRLVLLFSLFVACGCSGQAFGTNNFTAVELGDAQPPLMEPDGAVGAGGWPTGLGGAGGSAIVRATGGAGSGGAPAAGGRLSVGSGGLSEDAGDAGHESGGRGGAVGSGGAATGGSSSTGGAPGTGGVSGSGGGPACLTDLSGVGTGDFRIAFTITTTAHANVTLLEQRIGCDQSSMLWGVSLNYNGQIAAATADGLHWAATAGANSVADGKPHSIVFARTSGKIWISRDGVVDSIPVDDPYALGALPPLRIGVSDCPDSFWSAQKAGAVISDVCISAP